ncbi:MAG: peptidoglycan DD-metalloendopeptidase family protein [Proteobacteria bacterium]|nr:peptidoglycan DD-metalloendopeptidase family protein [Pseudomonadota bacterium]
MTGSDGSALAAPKSARIEAKQGQLKELQGHIATLQRDLAKSEETKAYAADQLKEAESAISAATRGLHELAKQRGEIQAALGDLQQQAQQLEIQIGKQQGQLGRLLYRQYVNGEADALHLLLAGSDPNQAARDLHYLTLLSRAKADLLGVLRTTLAEKHKLAAAARSKRDELVAVEQQQQQQRVALLAQQQRHQAVMARLADKIKLQQREIGALKRDEQRLGKLIEGLARIVAKAARSPRPAPVKPGRRAAQAPAQAPLNNQLTPETLSFSGNFARLKGSLHLPVRGQLANRFGTPRAESGATWKGLFIRAAEGGEVKAIAPGRVVFADWLRGFGNLLILDHGDTFLSVYGNNQSLFRQVGDTVTAGEVIATIGNSGGNPESGLYFELRQQGQAVDPLKWASLK